MALGPDFKHSEPFDMDVSSGPETGSPLVDAGFSMAQQGLWSLAGGEGPAQVIPNVSPGENVIEASEFLNNVARKQQELLAQYAANFNPAGNYVADLLTQFGHPKAAQQLRTAMRSPGAGQIVSQIVNQNPIVAKMLGGDTFQAYNELMHQAGAFGGGQMISNPASMSAARTQSLNHTNQVAGELTRRMFTDEDGRFTPVANPVYTGGFRPDDAMRMTGQMARDGLYANTQGPQGTPDGRQYMGSVNTPIDRKMDMHSQVMDVVASVARATKQDDPRVAYQNLQAYATADPVTGRGTHATRNVANVAQMGKEIDMLRGMGMAADVSSTSLMDTAQMAQAGVNMMVEGPGGVSGLEGTTYLRKQGFYAAADTAAVIAQKQMQRGAPVSEQEAREIQNRQIIKRQNNMRSTAHRGLTVANYAMAMMPDVGARYRDALEYAVASGSRTAQQDVTRRISMDVFGDAGALQRTANNSRNFTDFVSTADRYVTDRFGANVSSRVVSDIDRQTSRGLRGEFKERAENLEYRTNIKRYRGVMHDAGVKVDKDDMAKARAEGILQVLDDTPYGQELRRLAKRGEENPQRMLRDLKSYINTVPELRRYRDKIRTGEMAGATDEYERQTGRVDLKNVLPRKWERGHEQRMNIMLRNADISDERRDQIRQELRDIKKIKDPKERKRAREKFVKSSAFHAMGGTDEQIRNELKSLDRERDDLISRKEGQVIPETGEVRKKLGDRDQRVSTRESSPDWMQRVFGLGKDNAKGMKRTENEYNKRGDMIQRVLQQVRDGNVSVEALANVAGVDVSKIDINNMDAKDIQKIAGDTRRRVEGKNTITEVVLKEGTTLTIIENGQRRTAQVVR